MSQEKEIGSNPEEWYGGDGTTVYSFAPGMWERIERSIAAPSSLQQVWGSSPPPLEHSAGAHGYQQQEDEHHHQQQQQLLQQQFQQLHQLQQLHLQQQQQQAAAAHAAAEASLPAAASAAGPLLAPGGPSPSPAPRVAWGKPSTAAPPLAPGGGPSPSPAPRAVWGKLSKELRASAAAAPLFPAPAAEGQPGLAAAGGGGGPHPMRPSLAPTSAAFSSALAAVTAAVASVGGGEAPLPQRAQDRPGNTICSFYASGAGCRFGEHCKFRHVMAEPWALEWFENLLLDKLEQAGSGEGEGEEPEGASSGSSAASSGSSSAAAATDFDFAASSKAWLGASLESQQAVLQEAVDAGVCSDLDGAEVALGAAERAISRGIECSICLEAVTEAAGRRFGLLTCCAHAFCLECIRAWRARIDLPAATVRACPLCRRASYFVLPSDRYIAHPGRKAALSEEYHSAQRALPCRNFDQGRGVCPFGSSCFYAHLLPNGQPAPVARHTFLVNSDGEIRGVGKRPSLADFLFNK